MKRFQDLSLLDTVVVTAFFTCVTTVAFLIGKLLWDLVRRK